jgi:hypothetical protein
LGARLETSLVRLHHETTCCYYGTIAGKIPSPIFTILQRNHPDDNICQGATPFEKQDNSLKKID